MFLWSDGFDAYTATADLTKCWNANSAPASLTFNASGGRFGGGCIQQSGASASGSLVSPALNISLPANNASRMNIAGWFKCTAAPTNLQHIFGIATNGAVTSGQSIIIGTTGILQVLQFISGSNVTNITANSVCDNQWHWLEWQSTTSISQSHQIYLDGTLIWNAGVAGNVGAFGSTAVVYAGSGSAIGAGKTLYLDDVIYWDNETGLQTGEMTTFPLGPLRCRTGFPTGAGTNTNWVPDSGSNYARVNEVPADDDTSYIEASASGTRDSYTFGSFVPVQDLDPIGTIVKVRAKNTDAGSINAQGLTYSGGNYGLGDSKLVTSAYTTNMYPIFRDPSTSAAWTNSGINAAEFGVGIV